MTEKNRLYALSKEIFIKKSKPQYLNDTNEKAYKDIIKDSIKVAKLFLDEFEEQHGKK